MASLQGNTIKDTYKSLLKVADNGELEAGLQQITDGDGNGTGVSLNTSGDVTATGTVAFGSIKDSGENITVTKFVDEADGIAANDNDTSIPTSAAVKDYVDNNITAQDLDITDGTNVGAVDLDSQLLTFTGDAGVSATVSNQTVTFNSSALQSQITNNDTDITNLQTADATLQSNINAEESARIAADTALQTQITNNDTDITALQAADTTLQNNIDAEEAARIAADTTLQTNITAEATTRANADTTLQGNINTEEAARIAADTTLQTNITTEASTRASADTSLQNQITSNDGDITGLDTRLTTAEGNITSNDGDISALDGRLTTAEGNITSNDTDISNLDSRLTTAEGNITSNDSDISALQSGKQDVSEKNQANGYAPLDAGAKVPIANLPDSVVGQVEYQGTWNASTDTPTLPAASTVKGHYYVVSVAGTYETISYAIGDWIISNGTAWEKVDNTDAVTTVFGRLGAVVANESDYSSFYPLISDLNTTNSNVSGLDGRLTTAEGDITAIETKTDFITVTQAVNLDTIESDVTTNNAKISFDSASSSKLAGIEAGAEVNTVDSVNGATGVVVLDADDIDDTSTTHKFTSQTDIDKLAGIEAGAQVNTLDGSGTANYVSKWSDADTITNSVIYDDGTNVGIGTSSPGAILDVRGTNAGSQTLAGVYSNTGTTASSSVALALTTGSDGTLGRIRGQIVADSDGDNAGYLAFTTRSAGSQTERMRIGSNGNVAIGGTATGDALRIYNTGYPLVKFIDDSTDRGLLGYVFDWGVFSLQSESNLAFRTGASGGTERMRITSGGEVLVGTTSVFNAKLSVQSPAAFATSNFRSDSVTAAGTDWTHFYGTSSTNTVANIQIFGNGNIVNANNSYGAISDIKLKENIVDATPKLDDLLQVKIRNFNYIDDNKKQIGVVAQELEEIFPSMIDESPDYEEVEVTDEEGNVTTERVETGTTTKSVKYSVFVPMLIKAIQELKAEIELLKSQK